MSKTSLPVKQQLAQRWFKGTLQTMVKLLPLLATNISPDAWCDALLDAVATHVVGNRPEPRVKKRQPKPYRKMTKPRQEYKRRVT